MTTDILLGLALQLAVLQLPMFIIEGIGLWLAVSRRAQLGRVSFWAGLGFALLFINSVSNGIIRALIQMMQASTRAQTGNEVSTVLLATWSFVGQLVFVAGLAALTRAIFLNRGNAPAGTVNA